MKEITKNVPVTIRTSGNPENCSIEHCRFFIDTGLGFICCSRYGKTFKNISNKYKRCLACIAEFGMPEVG